MHFVFHATEWWRERCRNGAWFWRWFGRVPAEASFPSRSGHLDRGRRGEDAARAELRSRGWKFLTANFSGLHGEIDLVFQVEGGLVFAEVKTRSREDWTRPAAAVDARKQRRIALTALEYLERIGNPDIAFRFDIVEVLMDEDWIAEIRVLENAFPLPHPLRYR